MKPQKLKLKVKSIEWLTDKIVVLLFTTVEPDAIEWVPGQHIGIKVADDTSRPYCIYTNSNINNEIGIIVSAGHSGKGADYIKSLSEGDLVDGFGPVGRHKINTDYADSIVFAATGTGIAPMFSILDKMVDDKVESKISLFFGLRDSSDIFMIDLLEGYKVSLPNFNYEIVYSNPEASWEGLSGYVTDVVEAAENTQYYIVGHKNMVIDLKYKLTSNGVSEENIVG